MKMLLTLAMHAACSRSVTDYSFYSMTAFFPVDGERRAEYMNEDAPNVSWRLAVEKLEPVTEVNGDDIVTFEWSNLETGVLVGAVMWSSGNGGLVKIHGFADYTRGPAEFLVFDTPILFIDDYAMDRGEPVITRTNGYTFTSTLVAFEDCPVYWGPDWKQCAHIRLDDGDGDDQVGPIFSGDYWLAQRFGPAWMLLTGYTEKWNLAHYDLVEPE